MSGSMRFYVDSTAHTGSHMLVFDHRPRGPLTRLQGRLQAGRFWWLGNRVSDFRYWLYRLIR